MSNNRISICTAFFDIGRSDWTGFIGGHPLPGYLKRTTDEYFTNFERLLKLENDIIVFTSQDLLPRFEKYHLPNLTVIAFDDWERDLHPEIRKRVMEIQQMPSFYNTLQQPYNPEYWSPSYVMVNLLKSYFVNYAFEWDLVQTEMVSWLDFAYMRSDENLPSNNKWSYDFDPNTIHLFSGKQNVPHSIDIKELVITNNVLIHGCHIVASKNNWRFLMEEIFNAMNRLLDNNLVDDDQSLLVAAYVANPNLYEIHYINENDGGWFQAVKRFNDVN